MVSLFEGSSLGTPEVAGIVILAMGIIELAKLLINKAFAKKEPNGHDHEMPAAWQVTVERTMERVVQNKIDFRMQQIHEATNDIKGAVQTLIRWKGGD